MKSKLKIFNRLDAKVGIYFTLLSLIILVVFALSSARAVYFTAENTVSNNHINNVNELNITFDYDWIKQVSEGQDNNYTVSLHSVANNIKTLTNSTDVIWVDAKTKKSFITLSESDEIGTLSSVTDEELDKIRKGKPIYERGEFLGKDNFRIIIPIKDVKSEYSSYVILFSSAEQISPTARGDKDSRCCIR